jgi:hypothetical protein
LKTDENNPSDWLRSAKIRLHSTDRLHPIEGATESSSHSHSDHHAADKSAAHGGARPTSGLSPGECHGLIGRNSAGMIEMSRLAFTKIPYNFIS